MAIVLNARTLSLAESQGLDSLDDGLFYLHDHAPSGQQTVERGSRDPGYGQQAARRASALRYNATVDVRHFLWVLIADYGLDRLKEQVTRPLTDLSVAPYYGCHILRPSDVLGFDDPDNPRSLHDLITRPGGAARRLFQPGGLLWLPHDDYRRKSRRSPCGWVAG